MSCELLEGCRHLDCAGVFGGLTVRPTIRGATRVSWELNPAFRDPPPRRFQLLVGRTGLATADDWTPTGPAVDDTYFLLDDQVRVRGKTQWTHYRVCLQTETDEGFQTYFSEPLRADSSLDFRARQEYLTVSRTHAKLFRLRGSPGYLLKRRLFGLECPERCWDYLTEETNRPQCPTCKGTRFVDGYFEPEGCAHALLSERGSRNHLDGGQNRGTIDDDLRISARFLAVPQLFSYDVWVEGNSDNRWFIHPTRSLVEVRHVPVVVEAELRLAPYTDVVYTVQVPT